MKSIQLFLTLSVSSTIALTGNAMVNANRDVTHLHNKNYTQSTLLAEGGEGAEGGESGAKISPGEKANAEFQDEINGAELLSELQNGGYVIYFRHAQTEKDYADQVTADVNNCSTQRVLS